MKFSVFLLVFHFGFSVGLLGGELDAKVARSVEAIGNGKWAEGLEGLISVRGELEAGEVRLGVIAYHQGFCRMKLASQALGEESEALLRQAEKDFELSASIGKEGEGINIYKMRALLQLGVVQQRLGSFAKAASNYEEFLLKRDQLRDVYDHGLMLLNLSVCYVSSERVDTVKAQKYFLEALNSWERLTVGDEVVVNVFEVMVLGFLKEGKKEELDSLFSSFIDKVKLGDVARFRMGLGMLRCSSKAIDISAWDSASICLALVPKDELLAVALRKSEAKESKEYFKMKEQGLGFDLQVLERKAIIFEGEEKLVDALRIYKNLHKNYPLSKSREGYFYHLIRLAALLGKTPEVLSSRDEYMELFPKGRSRREVSLIALEAAMSIADYTRVVKLAKEALIEQEQDSDALEYLCKGTYFNGDYVTTLKLSREIQKNQKNKDLIDKMLFFEGASLVGLNYWGEAAVVLDRFLKKGQKGDYVRLAQYQRALVYRSESKLDDAVNLLNQLIDSNKSESVDVSALQLRGNIEQSRRERDKAEESYLSAKSLAAGLGDSLLEQESLFYLIEMLGQEYVGNSINNEIDKALPYVDVFMGEYLESEYAVQVMVAAYPVMKKAGRLDEYVTRLKPILVKSAVGDRNPGLSLAVNTYARALQARGAKFVDVEREFLLEGEGNHRYQAVLRDGLASIYKTFAERSWKKGSYVKAMQNEVKYRAVMSSLAKDWHKGVMPPYVALNVANYLAENSFEEELTQKLYESVANRGILVERLRAGLGVAQTMKGDSNSISKMQDLLDGVIRRDGYGGEMGDYASYLLAKSYLNNEVWDDLVTLCRNYATGEGELYRAEMTYYLAFGYEKKGMFDDAITLYGRIYASYLKRFDISAPTVKNLTRLTWKRNLNSDGGAGADRQVAYRLASRYINATYEDFGKKRAGLEKEVLEAWLAVEADVLKWEKSGEVKTVKELLEDKKRGRKSF